MRTNRRILGFEQKAARLKIQYLSFIFVLHFYYTYCTNATRSRFSRALKLVVKRVS